MVTLSSQDTSTAGVLRIWVKNNKKLKNMLKNLGEKTFLVWERHC